MNWFKPFILIPQPLPEPVSILYDEITYYNKFKQKIFSYISPMTTLYRRERRIVSSWQK
jgi:hypothetical protein